MRRKTKRLKKKKKKENEEYEKNRVGSDLKYKRKGGEFKVNKKIKSNEWGKKKRKCRGFVRGGGTKRKKEWKIWRERKNEKYEDEERETMWRKYWHEQLKEAHKIK